MAILQVPLLLLFQGDSRHLKNIQSPNVSNVQTQGKKREIARCLIRTLLRVVLHNGDGSDFPIEVDLG